MAMGFMELVEDGFSFGSLAGLSAVRNLEQVVSRRWRGPVEFFVFFFGWCPLVLVTLEFAS
jgi:hypothetical protein